MEFRTEFILSVEIWSEMTQQDFFGVGKAQPEGGFARRRRSSSQDLVLLCLSLIMLVKVNIVPGIYSSFCRFE